LPESPYNLGVVSRRQLGAIGEEAAVRALRRRGYRIRDRNVRCPMGELDLVAEDRGTLVFLEVKTRSTSDYGGPFEAISLFKQQRLQRLAVYYLSTRRLMDRPCRFDAVSVCVDSAGRIQAVELLVDAFEAEPR